METTEYIHKAQDAFRRADKFHFAGDSIPNFANDVEWGLPQILPQT